MRNCIDAANGLPFLLSVKRGTNSRVPDSFRIRSPEGRNRCLRRLTCQNVTDKMKLAPCVPSKNPLACSPPLRWAGGKRSLASRLTQFLPGKYGTYYEPMVGSGALFFSLIPERAVLGDINCELINFYRVLSNQPQKLYDAVNGFTPAEEAYYSLRASCPTNPLGRAARFFYLVRLSWNGLYRVNKEGAFNVPYSGRKPKQLLFLQAAQAASQALKTVRLLCGDFQRTTLGVKPEDCVYFDPPYPKGASKGNGFSRYSSTGFTLDDHKRLAHSAAQLADKGVHVLVTEAARKEILKFYSKSFYISFVRTPSLIAADSEFRRDVYEAILTSYRVQQSHPGRTANDIWKHSDARDKQAAKLASLMKG